MRILHLNTYDITGGAARAAYRLHRGLRQCGHDSVMFVAHRKCDDASVREFVPSMRWRIRIRRKLRSTRLARDLSRYRATRPAGYEMFSDDRTPIGGELIDQLPPCDVITLHWITGFLDLGTFFSLLPRKIPVFWRLSDMNPLTGGCHYDDGCGRYVRGCGNCPQLGSRDASDLSHQVWRRKKTLFSGLAPGTLHIIALNRWMADVVEESPLLGGLPVTIIPNGVDTDCFAPRGTPAARDILGLPQDAGVVLFVADSARNRRKGFARLAEALSGLRSGRKLFLLSVGRGDPRLETDIPHAHVGYLDNDRLLSVVYSAADVFVMPSIQDNQPNTVLESMACGTPVVGFDVGGTRDMVRPGINGLLVQPEDVSGLRAAILELLESRERRLEMGAACRSLAVREYARRIQIERYVQLYESRLGHDR